MEKQATGAMSLLSKYIYCGRVKVWQNTKVVSCISEWHTRLNPPTSTGYHYCYCFYQYTTTTSQMTNLQRSLRLSKSVFLNLMCSFVLQFHKIIFSFFPLLVFGFWSLLATMLRKYYMIFVCIL